MGQFSKGVTYNKNSTNFTIASALATAINADSSYPVSASTNGRGDVFLTAKTVGGFTNYSLTAIVQSTSGFNPPRFTATASGQTLTGGRDASGPDTASLSSPMTTTYTYDMLDNLLTVSQAAMGPVQGQQLPGQARSYAYDSLSRLTSATTPESGTVNFYYTTAGGGTCSFDPSKVCRRVDARGITTTYAYDGLGRLQTVSYSDSTPTVTYTYGTSAASNNNGRLIALADGTSSESYTYDAMGRITNVSKIISGVTYNVGYSYNAAGQLQSLTYPSGRIVSQGYDAMGRVSTIASGPTMFSSPTYNAAGQLLSFAYGNGTVAYFQYNERLQLAHLYHDIPAAEGLVLQYLYNANGQIREIKHYSEITNMEDLTKSRNFEYDAWGRLKKAYTTDLSQQGTWRLEWEYDRFGNRRTQTLTGGQGGMTQPQLEISETTNRIITPGYAYDAAGNLTNDSIHAYTFDAENRIKTMDGTTATYSYSGPLRVKKVLNSQGTFTRVYIYSGSKVIAEYWDGALHREYIYLGDQLLYTVRVGETDTYHHFDHLSQRLATDSSGNVQYSGSHFPFGEGGVPDKWAFTSYERDESGLDYAIFRYYSPRIGRFMSADVVAGSTNNPQALNRYSYVGNNPSNFVDPFGLFCIPGRCPGDPGSGPYSAERGSCRVYLDGICIDLFFSIYPFVDGGGEDTAPKDRAREIACDPKVIAGLKELWQRHKQLNPGGGSSTGKREVGFRIDSGGDDSLLPGPIVVGEKDSAVNIPTYPDTVAVAHTHPQGTGPSPHDIDKATSWGKPIFVLTQYKLYVAEPGNDKPRTVRDYFEKGPDGQRDDWMKPCPPSN